MTYDNQIIAVQGTAVQVSAIQISAARALTVLAVLISPGTILVPIPSSGNAVQYSKSIIPQAVWKYTDYRLKWICTLLILWPNRGWYLKRKRELTTSTSSAGMEATTVGMIAILELVNNDHKRDYDSVRAELRYKAILVQIYTISCMHPIKPLTRINCVK